jgi:hypothetical protein
MQCPSVGVNAFWGEGEGKSMDLRHILRVVRHYRGFVLLGLALAVILSVASYATPGVKGAVPTLKPRGVETWRAEAILAITERGFPQGRAIPTYRPSDPKRGTPAVLVGDQDRLASLAALYAQYASSDRVRRLALRDGPLNAEVSAEPVTYTTTQFAYPQVLPLIRITSTAATPSLAINGARRVGDAFTAYVRQQQNNAAIPKSDRVLVDYARRPAKAVLFKGRSKILPALMFFCLTSLVIGSALVLDNLRRSGEQRTRAVPEPAPEPIEMEVPSVVAAARMKEAAPEAPPRLASAPRPRTTLPEVPAQQHGRHQ